MKSRNKEKEAPMNRYLAKMLYNRDLATQDEYDQIVESEIKRAAEMEVQRERELLQDPTLQFQSEHQAYQEPKNKASVTFYVDLENQIGISCKWDDQYGDANKVLGTMLFLMNNGGLEEEIQNILIHMSEHSGESMEFVKGVLEQWAQHKKEEDQVVKPSDVFGVGMRTSVARKELVE